MSLVLVLEEAAAASPLAMAFMILELLYACLLHVHHLYVIYLYHLLWVNLGWLLGACQAALSIPSL